MIDSTGLTIEQVVERVLAWERARRCGLERPRSAFCAEGVHDVGRRGQDARARIFNPACGAWSLEATYAARSVEHAMKV